MTQGTKAFLDLEIHIAARRDDRYPVRIRLGDGQDFAGELAADVTDWLTSGDPQADGQRLFAVLFADPKLHHAWDVASGRSIQRHLRLWLDADAPELHALPWELLHEGQTFLAADAATPFSRYLPSDMPWGGLVTERPIRILAVISNPADLAQPSYNLTSLNVTAEQKLLTDALGDLVPTHFQLETLDAPVTLERLERALASAPHVLHFVGHGAFSERRQEAALYLQDAAGNTQIVTDTQLCDILRRQAKLPSLIFLAACQSAERSTLDAFAGLAPKLVQAGVTAVVAMQDKVAVAATHKLTPMFYEELARHGEVDRALNASRSLLLTGQSVDAATPVLLMRLKNGKLWEPLWAKTNPYRGLDAFTEADAAFFFGREKLIEELSAKARSQRFIAVVGPSGSGKSSAVQAGLLPRLPKDWQVIKLRPGSDPYANEEWRMANGEKTADSLTRRFVLFIDQFEELFALCSPEVQARFLADVQALIASPTPITVILTLRADFFGHLQNSPLGKHLEHALVNVLPMEPADLRAAITNPAQAVGLRFEAGLVETIVKDARQARHTLPLLQAALTQLWEQQTQGTLTYEAYVATGQVAGAIGLWAEDMYNGLTTKEQQLARRIFTRLVHYGEGDAADTRQRRTLSELLTQSDEHDALHRLLQRLADKRLLTTDEAQGGESVEIIHDALLKEWPRLEHWLTEQREFYLWRQRLDAQLQVWQGQDRDSSALLRGKSLDEAVRWLELWPDDLNVDESTYIRAGMLHRRRQRIILGSALLFFILAILATIFGIQQRDLQINERARATEQAALATATVALGEAQDSLATATIALGEAEIERQRANRERDTAREAEAVAETERYRAEQEAKLALSGGLAAQARAHLEEDLDLALLLAVEAFSAANTFQARDILLTALQYNPQLFRFMRTPDVILSVAFSPDDKVLASGSCAERDSNHNCLRGNIFLWDVASGRLIGQPLVGHTREVIGLAFSPDGKTLASSSYDKTIILWNIDSGHPIRSPLTGYTAGASSLIFSPDGKMLASGGCYVFSLTGGVCKEGELLLWNVESGETIGQPLAGSAHTQSNLTFSPDGQTLVSGDCARIEKNTLNVDQCTLGEVRLWDVLTGQLTSVPLDVTTSGITGVAFSPNGKILAAGDAGGVIYLLDAETWEPVSDPLVDPVSSLYVTNLFFTPDGKTLVSSSFGNPIVLWDMERGNQASTRLSPYGDRFFSPEGLTLNSNGTILASSGCEKYAPSESSCLQGGIFLWNMETDQSLSQAIPIYADLVRVNKGVFSPNGGILASAICTDYDSERYKCSQSEIRLWDIESGYSIGQPLTGYSAATDDIVFSSNGAVLASVGCSEYDVERPLLCVQSEIHLWDVHTRRLITSPLVYDDWVLDIALSPDGSTLVSAGKGNVIIVWNVASGLQIGQPLVGHSHNVHSLAFSPDGKILASASCSEASAVQKCNPVEIRLWDMASRQPLGQPLTGHTGFVNILAFNPNGNVLVSSSSDRTTISWNVETGQQIGETLASGGRGLAFNPDGNILAIGSCESVYNCQGIISLWDIAARATIGQPFRGHSSDANNLAFSPDGKLLLSGSAENTIIMWDINPLSWQARACSIANRNLTPEEWNIYMGNLPYRPTCQDLPASAK